jgi:hypothetical protein
MYTAGTQILEMLSFGLKKWKLGATHQTRKQKNILFSLAKTPELQQEANELVGNDAIQLEVDPDGEEVDGSTGYEVRQIDARNHLLLDDASTSSLNGRNKTDDYAFDEEEDEKDRLRGRG